MEASIDVHSALPPNWRQRLQGTISTILFFGDVRERLLVVGRDAKWIQETEDLYRKFLLTTACYHPYQLVPSPDIDEFWCTHILVNTERYIRDCERVFGRILHRRVAVDMEAWRRTCAVFRQEFGIHLEHPAKAITY